MVDHRENPQDIERSQQKRLVELPYENIKTNGGATNEEEAELISGVAQLLVRILNKSLTTNFVVIDEVGMEDWGVGAFLSQAIARRFSSP
jgi:4-oxalocrotonate tautomerase